MRTSSAATAFWVDEAEALRDHEIEEIRSRLAVAWRSFNESVEEKLVSNGESEAVISDMHVWGRSHALGLHEICRALATLYAQGGDADSLALVAAMMQDLVVLKERVG